MSSGNGFKLLSISVIIIMMIMRRFLRCKESFPKFAFSATATSGSLVPDEDGITITEKTVKVKLVLIGRRKSNSSR